MQQFLLTICRHALVACAFFAAFSSPTFAQTAQVAAAFNEGSAAYERRDFRAAFNAFHFAAEQGFAPAQFNIAMMYDDGQGVAQNKSAAINWYRKAAEQGHRDAQFNLAVAYKDGIGVQKDMPSAIVWYRKAAEQGDAEAQLSLALAYENGDGIAPNDVAALNWYRKSAEQGNESAQVKMGNMYVEGKGIPMNYGTALTWYRLAAKQGSSYANDRIADIEKYVAADRKREQQMADFIKQSKERTAKENAAAAQAAAAEECGWACMNARSSANALKTMQEADSARRSRDAKAACISQYGSNSNACR